MSDFKDFVDNVLAPVRAGDSSQPAQIILAADGESQTTPPKVPLDELDRRYVAVMDALLVDAQARGAVRVFTDAVTWKLAVVAYQYGPDAVADVLRKLGGHMGNIVENMAAQSEANAAKEAGQQFN